VGTVVWFFADKGYVDLVYMGVKGVIVIITITTTITTTTTTTTTNNNNNNHLTTVFGFHVTMANVNSVMEGLQREN